MNVDYLVIGGGVAGFSAASRIVELDPGARVTLVDGEGFVPYKRTKLSKELARSLDPPALELEPAGWYARSGIRLELGNPVQSLDVTGRAVRLGDGRVLGFHRALLALGVRPAVPPQVPPATVCHRFWNLADAMDLRAAWDGLGEVCILGNGVLALELADQALALGKKVRILARKPLPLEADLGPGAAALIRRAAEARGVLWEPLPRDARDWPAQVALACGTEANLDLALAAGIRCDRGILVDDTLRTSDPAVWSAGDCARLPDGRMSHLWHESEAMGRAAAASMVRDKNKQGPGSGSSVISGSGDGFPLESKPASGLPVYRMKAEVFGQYLWTMGYRGLSGEAGLPEGLEVLEESLDSSGAGKKAADPVKSVSGPVFRTLVFREGRLAAAVVLNDKDRNKTWEQAVRESWTKKELLERLPLA